MTTPPPTTPHDPELARAIIASAANYAIVAADTRGILIDWNEAAERILGWSRAEALGQPASLFFVPEDCAAGVPQEEMRKARENGFAADNRGHLKKDGSRFWANGEMTPLRRVGALVGYAKILRDRTAERATSEALRETSEFSQRVLDSSQDSIEVLDLDGRRLSMSRGGMALKEIDDIESVPGADWLAAWTGPAGAEAGHALLEAKAGRTARFHGAAATVRGTPKDWDVTLTPILGAEGAPERLLVISRDVTEARRAEEAVRTANAQLAAETDRLRDSEREFRTLAEAVPNHAWAAGPDGRLNWFNRRIYDYTGARPGDLDGDAWAGVVHPDDLPGTVASWLKAVAEGSLYETEFRLCGQDGNYRWFLARAVPMRGDDGRVLRWIGTNTDVDEQKNVAAELARLNATLEQEIVRRTTDRDRLWQLSADVMLLARFDATITAVNPAWTALLGWTERELVGSRFIGLVHADDHAATVAEVDRLKRGMSTQHFENRMRHRDGSYRSLSWTAVPDAGSLYAVGRDVTTERAAQTALEQTEESLRQAQKMDAIGQLTGGIAHDFNNLLQGIVGSLDLIQKRVDRNQISDLKRFVVNATTSANRAAALTHRLLAFSRRQPLDPKPVKVNPLVASMEDLLRRTLGKATELELVLSGGLWLTLCDSNQVESALLNLAINARDAMPDGGRLTIETCNTHLDSAYVDSQREVRPGQYVCISVSDSGVGMSPDVFERAFDPFFTTKPIGQGTGLGLSMIYGFAKQSDGHAKIYSELGSGTTVMLYLPRHRGEDAVEPQSAIEMNDRRAEKGETVLVVEDEPVVRTLIVEVLTDLGYRVLQAGDGASGLAILQSPQWIDLLLTDVGLPGLNGRQVSDAARLTRPELKVLFMTGYAENAARTNGFLEHGMAMMTKPFTIELLVTRVREILETG
jgi:PAS domain S-box-containing protein